MFNRMESLAENLTCDCSAEGESFRERESVLTESAGILSGGENIFSCGIVKEVLHQPSTIPYINIPLRIKSLNSDFKRGTGVFNL